MELNKYPDLKAVYEPPITLYMNEIQTQIEDNCLKAVQSYGFNVDKDELKKALDYDRGQFDKGYVNGYLKAKRTYERPHEEWIPVSERLPEQAHKTYLVTVDFGGGQLRSCEMYFYGGDIGWNYGGITAWQPLPEPYKEDDAENVNSSNSI